MLSIAACIQASKLYKKTIFPVRSPESERKILDKFRNGYGPDAEEIEMFKQALIRLKEEEPELVKDVHWGHYPTDILLH